MPTARCTCANVIRVRAEGRNIRRGIYRDFPTIYSGSDGRQYRGGLLRSRSAIARRPGRAMAHGKSRQRRTHLPRQPFRCCAHGEHTYELVYPHRPADGLLRRSRRAVLERHRQWLGFPDRSRHGARGACRRRFRRAEIKLEAYTGPQGAKGQDYTATMQATRYRCSRPRAAFEPREGLTIVAMWPKGFITAAGRDRCPPVPGPPPAPATTT